MRTTVNIDDHLLAEAKVRAVRTQRSLGDVIEDALREMFGRGQGGSGSAERVVLPTDGGSGLQPGVDLEDKDSLAELLGDNEPHRAAR